MKRKIIIVVLCVFAASFLAACGANETVAQTISATTSTVESDEIALSTQLLLGSLELEDSELAISADQASELLPLWKAVRVLSESDTASSVELEALYKQIQTTMTEDQLEAITDFAFDSESIFAFLEEMGLGMASGGSMGEASGSEDQQMPNDMGGITGMAPEGGDDIMMAAGNMSGDETAEMPENSGSMEDSMVLTLLDPMIELLEERVL